MDLKYVIWRTNRFDDDILQDIVAKFADLELAKDFVNYQATLAESFVITKDGKRVEL